jgi:hypothetical protein
VTWFWYTNQSLLLLRLPWTTTVLRMIRSSLHGFLNSLVHTYGKCLLLAHIHGNYLLSPLTCKASSVPSRFPRIRVSIERVLANRCLAMDYSGFQTSCHDTYLFTPPLRCIPNAGRCFYPDEDGYKRIQPCNIVSVISNREIGVVYSQISECVKWNGYRLCHFQNHIQAKKCINVQHMRSHLIKRIFGYTSCC